MKKLIVLFSALILSIVGFNLALAHGSFSKGISVAKKEGDDAAVWKFITSTSDRSVNVFYRIENSDLVFEFMNLSHNRNVKIYYQFRCESRISWENQSSTFFSSITVGKNRIEYTRVNIVGAPESARITLFKILSVEFSQE